MNSVKPVIGIALSKPVFMWIRIAICDAIYANCESKRQVYSHRCDAKITTKNYFKNLHSREYR